MSNIKNQRANVRACGKSGDGDDMQNNMITSRAKGSGNDWWA